MPGKGSRSRTPEILILISSAAAFVLTVVACLCADEVGRAGTAVMAISALACALVSANMMVHAGGSAAGGLLVTVLLICMLAFAFSYILYYLFTRPCEEAIPAVEELQVAEDAVPADAQREQESSSLDIREEESVAPETEESTEETVTAQETLLHDMDGEDIHVMAESGETDTLPGYGEDAQETSGQEPQAGLCEEAVPPTKSEDEEQPGAIVADVPDAPSGLFATTMVEGEGDEEQPIESEPEPDALESHAVQSSGGTGMFAGLSQEEADFWSTFYVAGQDDLALEDGYYYMDLYINDNNVGNIETLVESGCASISGRDLHAYISDNVVDSLVDSIFASKEDFITLSSLEELGVGTLFDSSDFEIRLSFSPSDMPIQILSVRGTPRHSVFRPIAGGMWIDPAVFVLRSSYSLSARLSNLQNFDPADSMRFTFSSSNTGRLLDLNFNFSYYMNFGADYFDFALGSYSFYMDFEKPMIRLSFGNVSPDVLYPSGRSIGVRFDRSYAYGPEDASRASQTETLLVVDKRSEVTIYNEGREIFRRTLDPGRYRLQDFILYTGANEILIRVEPLDGSAPKETIMNVNYSSSLIAPGDFYFGGSIVTGRNNVFGGKGRSGTLRLPVGDDEYFEYDWRNVTASFYLRTGITESMSINTALGLQNIPDDEYEWNPRMKLNTEITHANILGTTRYTFNMDEKYDENRRFSVPGIYARVGHQVSTGWSPISSLSLGFTYSNPQEAGRERGHRLSFSASLSGRLGIVSWSSSFSGTTYTDRIDELSWSQSNSISLNLSRNFWMSGSLMFSGSASQQTRVYGRVYATLRFGDGSMSASSSMDDLSVNASYRVGNHSLSSSFNIDDFDNDVRTYSVGAGYDYSGHYFNFNASMNSDVLFKRTNLNLSLSTSSVFADGMFAFGASIPGNFLMIRQKGALRGNDLSLGSPGTSSAIELDSTFGTYMYSGLSTSRGSAFSLYSTGDDSFSSSVVFDINVPQSDRYGYVLRIEAEETYSVAGYAVLGDVIWSNGSSPVYAYDVDGNGNAVLAATDIYVFSDTDGLFVLSGLEDGTYAFDINLDGDWYLMVFTVGTDVPHGTVQMLVVGDEEAGAVLPDVYSGSYSFELQDVISSDDFWLMIYPEMEVAA